MSMVKKMSTMNGRKFLQESFQKQQKLLMAELELSATSISHDGKRGDVDERYFIRLLRSYLPNRYCVDSAIAIDSHGHTSDQLDVVIYDRQYTPTLLDQMEHKYVPAEAIYGVLEVKPIIDKGYLVYAARKAESVRRLYRTSLPVPQAGGPAPPKPLFEILAGIVAPRIGWKDGFGPTFAKIHTHLRGSRRIDCGVAVVGHSFDVFSKDGKYTMARGDNALVFFLFRLLEKLQSQATVPVIDWSAYASKLKR